MNVIGVLIDGVKVIIHWKTSRTVKWAFRNFIKDNLVMFIGDVLILLKDFGLELVDANLFEQALFVLKEVRNQCAHLELITRFRLKRSKGLNYLNDITVKANLSHGDINYLDVVRIFRVFGTVSDIKREILLFYLKMLGKRRKEIADKILAKMGRKNLKVWMNL